MRHLSLFMMHYVLALHCLRNITAVLITQMLTSSLIVTPLVIVIEFSIETMNV